MSHDLPRFTTLLGLPVGAWSNIHVLTKICCMLGAHPCQQRLKHQFWGWFLTQWSNGLPFHLAFNWILLHLHIHTNTVLCGFYISVPVLPSSSKFKQSVKLLTQAELRSPTHFPSSVTKWRVPREGLLLSNDFLWKAIVIIQLSWNCRYGSLIE